MDTDEDEAEDRERRDNRSTPQATERSTHMADAQPDKPTERNRINTDYSTLKDEDGDLYVEMEHCEAASQIADDGGFDGCAEGPGETQEEATTTSTTPGEGEGADTG